MKTLALVFSILAIGSFAQAETVENVMAVTINGQLAGNLVANEKGEVFELLPATVVQENITAEQAMDNYQNLIRKSIVSGTADANRMGGSADASGAKHRLPSIQFDLGSELKVKKIKAAGRKFYALDLELGDSIYPDFVNANDQRGLHFLLGCTNAGKAPAGMATVIRTGSEMTCGIGGRYIRQF